MSQQDPTFLVAENRDGKPALAGRRRLVDGLDDAIDAAAEIGGKAFALEPIEENHVAPVAALTHVGIQAIESNRQQSEYFAGIAGLRGTAYPEAYPDPEDLDAA